LLSVSVFNSEVWAELLSSSSVKSEEDKIIIMQKANIRDALNFIKMIFIGKVKQNKTLVK